MCTRHVCFNSMELEECVYVSLCTDDRDGFGMELPSLSLLEQGGVGERGRRSENRSYVRLSVREGELLVRALLLIRHALLESVETFEHGLLGWDVVSVLMSIHLYGHVRVYLFYCSQLYFCFCFSVSRFFFSCLTRYHSCILTHQFGKIKVTRPLRRCLFCPRDSFGFVFFF